MANYFPKPVVSGSNIGRSILIVALLILARIGLSSRLDSGKIASDEITYTGILVNLMEHGRLTLLKLPPPGESSLALTECVSRLKTSGIPQSEFIDYQWFGILIYIPVILLQSTKILLLLNNLLYLLAGFLAWKLVRKESAVGGKYPLLFAGVYLFFPVSFWFLTNRLLTEPMFVVFLLLSTLILFSERKSGWYLAAGVICLTLLSLIRPLGIIFCLTVAGWSVLRKDLKRAVVALAAIGVAVMLNAAVKNYSLPEGGVNTCMTSSPPLVFYYSMTSHGNGSTDDMRTDSVSRTDQEIIAYNDKKISGLELIFETLHQDLLSPSIFLRNSVHKSMNYFLNVWAASWEDHPGAIQQTFTKKVVEGAFNIVVIGILSIWCIRSRSPIARFYIIFSILAFGFHFVFDARYRYFVPVVYLGLPGTFAYLAELYYNKRGANLA